MKRQYDVAELMHFYDKHYPDTKAALIDVAQNGTGKNKTAAIKLLTEKKQHANR